MIGCESLRKARLRRAPNTPIEIKKSPSSFGRTTRMSKRRKIAKASSKIFPDLFLIATFAPRRDHDRNLGHKLVNSVDKQEALHDFLDLRQPMDFRRGRPRQYDVTK